MRKKNPKRKRFYLETGSEERPLELVDEGIRYLLLVKISFGILSSFLNHRLICHIVSGETKKVQQMAASTRWLCA